MNNVVTQSHRFAKNSMKNMVSNIRTYIFFTTYFDLPFLPAKPMDLCLFSELMALTCGYGHIKNILSSVKYVHEAYGHSFPANEKKSEKKSKMVPFLETERKIGKLKSG